MSGLSNENEAGTPASPQADASRRKGKITKNRILNAGMMVLVEQGYGGFSASAVADRAKLSRMAMLYHFPTLQTLLSALAEYVAQRRVDVFLTAIKSVPATESYKGQAYRAAVADMAWSQLQAPEFLAFNELVGAARTDAMLADAIRPGLEAFDSSRRRISEQLFPPGSTDAHDFQLARDVVRFLSGGIGHGNSTIVENRDERLARMKHFIQMLVSTTAGNAFLEQVSADWAKQVGTETAPPISAG